MVVAHVSTNVGVFVDSQQHLDLATRICSKVVPLIGTHPERRQHGSRGVNSIDYVDSRLRYFRMAVEDVDECAEQITVPGPVVLCIAGRVNTNVPAASANIACKRCLLVAIKYLTGGKQEDNGVVACQVGIGKGC